jgi:phenylalanyl-tRNA synthetase beta chain
MKVSVNWLRELVDTNLSVDELAHTLTMAGLEVEEMTPVAAEFDRIVVAEVKSTAPHPNADKLRVCEVDAGTGAVLQIVCGAPNVAPGMRVPCALVGAKLPGLEIKQAKLRGVESNGMLCSARELGLSDDHGGLLPLAADAPIGQDIRKYLDLDDVYLTLKMTPNRGDCLSMIGIARDLAAITDSALRIPEIAAVAATDSTSRPINIDAKKACGQYLGRAITGINAKAGTPDWMKRRLERAGFRSIAPLVDITNYLTLERGRPMHAFDNDKLNGGINVRFAQAGEEMKLLNEQHVELQPDMLLITDGNGPVGLGGVMGGLESMCTDETRNVFFEAAYFDPNVIQGKTRTLGINSDAAYRFERGVDPHSARDGIEYATHLALAICGTADTQVGPIVEAVGELPQRAAVRVRPERTVRLIGMQIPVSEMVESLQRLQCKVVEEQGALLVTPPSYRFDLNIEEDFVEEIARVHGYENVPSLPPVSSLPMMAIPEDSRSRSAIRHVLADLGYQEVINYSFTPETWEADFSGKTTPLRLANPIASQMSVMRSTLVGGLIAALQHNLNHGENRVKLFEIGRCFLADEASVAAQPERVGGLAYGARYPEQWGEGGQKGVLADFYSLKGEIEILLQGFRVRFEKSAHPALHPGRSAQILIDGKPAGMIGELHPQWQQKYDLPASPILFEVDISAISTVVPPIYRHISRMQAIRRDIALLVPETIEIQSIIDTITDQKIPSVIEFAPFDIYRGQNIESGKKSVALRVVMQDTDRTLTDSEADSKVSEIVEVLYQKFGVTLRK